MNRRSKKTPNQNSTLPPNHGPFWQFNAPIHNDWGHLDEPFCGGIRQPSNRKYPKHQRWGNDQTWGPGDQSRNNWKKSAKKFSNPKQQKFPWSTEKTKSTTDNSKDDTASINLNYGKTSFPSNKEDPKEMKNMMQEQNKQLMIGLSKPVECSIAERMMQKMGWQGGGLGVKEEGRTEPIEVNLTLINKTTGLGHNNMKQQKTSAALQRLPNSSKLPIKPYLYLQPVTLDLSQPEQTEKKSKKIKKQTQTINHKRKSKNNDAIDLGILDTILDFVMDVKQIEYSFNVYYSKKKRAIIHNFIEYLREGNNEEILLEFDDLHMNKIDEIYEYNTYVLMTESRGKFPKRQLFVYKVAPDEVYLVTRDDLVEYKVDDSEDVINDDVKNAEIDKTMAVNKNTAEKINNTADLFKKTESKVVESGPNIELDKKSLKASNNIVVNSISMEFIENRPNNVESNIFSYTKINESVNEDLKVGKIKNKHTVADFIASCSQEYMETQDTKTITKTDILKNNLNESQIHLNNPLQVNNLDTNNTKEENNSKVEEIIEIDLTESEELEPATPLKSPKREEQNTKTTEIKEETNDNNSQYIENDIDVELAKLLGKPKLEHFEDAFYIYLRDFLKHHDVYTEMRFLGDFGEEGDEESDLLAKLLADICDVSNRSKHFNLFSKEDVYKEVYTNDTYLLQLEKDCNGGHVLHKILRNDPKED